jgi:hypothetical protein
MPIVQHTKGIAESIFLADSSVSKAVRLVLLYLFRTIATPVFSGHFVISLGRGSFRGFILNSY